MIPATDNIKKTTTTTTTKTTVATDQY